MPFKALTTEQFKEKLKSKVGDEYILVSEYVRGNLPVLLRHSSCGRTIKVTPNHFIYDGRRCRCGRPVNSVEPKKFEKKFNQLSKGNYKLLSPYTGSHSKVKVLHNKCQTVYYVTPHDFMQGTRCPKCYGNPRKTTEEFSSEVLKLTHGSYELCSPYHNNRTKCTIKHKECGHKYLVTPHDFLDGNRCPYCRESKGEKLVEDILSNLGTPFITQQVFPDCGSNNQRLPFDFYLPESKLLIEYDGIQHFKPVEYFGGYKKLKDQQRRDKLKNEYALSKGLSVLRISYTSNQESLASKLQNFLNMRKAEELKPNIEFMI